MLSETKLFTEVTSEESATVSGGTVIQSEVGFDLGDYLFILGAGVVFGNPGLTPKEVNFAFEESIKPIVNGVGLGL